MTAYLIVDTKLTNPDLYELASANSWSWPGVLAALRIAGIGNPRRLSGLMPNRAMPASSSGRALCLSKARASGRRLMMV